MQVSKVHIINWLKKAAQTLADNQDLLTELDRDIGDADHGLNMNRGFRKVAEQLDSSEAKDIGVLLKNTGMTLLSSIGGASGPLYGTFFIRAASAVNGKNTLTLAELTQLFQAGCEGVKQRGKAVPGDKTMIDAMDPLVTTLLEMSQASLKDALEAALNATRQGMKDTIPLVAKKGRASYLGERSAGHQDPGATSTYLLFSALVQSINE